MILVGNEPGSSSGPGGGTPRPEPARVEDDAEPPQGQDSAPRS